MKLEKGGSAAFGAAGFGPSDELDGPGALGGEGGLLG